MSMFSESLRAFLKPVAPFLDDPAVSEILINGPGEIWVEIKGKLSLTDAKFTEDGLMAAARNMAQYVGRQLSEEKPRLDARLPDGSRIHVVLPPVARQGCTIAIRKFFPDRLGLDALIGFGSITQGLATLLQALVQLRLNIVVAGGTGSGKTSLLNVLSSCVSPDERILTIEDSAELQLQQPHIVSFETRPPDRLGKGEVTIGDLLASALRLRPDRIVVGEVRGGECFYLLQAMNTGHGGSLTTAHANTPVDTLRRLESLCLLSGVDLPLRAVRAQVASAVHIVVCCERLADGSRKVTSVSEALPLDEKGEYRVQDLFVYTQTGKAADGKIEGYHAPTGLLPTFFAKLAPQGYGHLDARFFDPASQGLPVPPLFSAELGPRSQWARELVAKLPPGPSPAPSPTLSPTPAPSPTLSPTPAPSPTLSPTPAPAPTHSPSPAPTPSHAPRPAASPARVRAPGAVRATPLPPAASKTPVPERVEARLEPKPPDRPPDKLPELPKPPVLEEEASIQLDPELAAEVEAAMPFESTLITRNPLLDQRTHDDDATNPGARNPTRR